MEGATCCTDNGSINVDCSGNALPLGTAACNVDTFIVTARGCIRNGCKASGCCGVAWGMAGSCTADGI